MHQSLWDWVPYLIVFAFFVLFLKVVELLLDLHRNGASKQKLSKRVKRKKKGQRQQRPK